MKIHTRAVAVFLGCCMGLACSQSSTGGSGGSGSGGQTGASSGGSSAGGSGAGGASSGSGGSSVSVQGGSPAGGAAGASSGGVGAGGTGSGGSKTGGAGGSQGTGGAAPGGSGGATKATGGAGGEGGGTSAGGASGKGSGGTTQPGSGGSTGAGTGGSTGAGTGGSSGTAAGGSTGGGGASASPVVPTTVASSGRDRFAWDDVIFEVDPKVGARVGKLSLGGADMVVSSGTKTDQTDWGAVFWTSPQTAWGTASSGTNWPPPAEIDKNAYTGGISGAHLVLDSFPYATLGVSVSKDFSADSATGWITIAYTIKASKAIQAAPWENCRVPRGGLAFFPSGTSLTKGPLTMTESGGMVWFDDASKSAKSPSGDKAIADGSGGFMAYALGGNLLVRKFTDTPASAQAPKEGEDEIYPGEGFLELEVQGPYTSIPAGGSLSWTVAWRIVKIPSSVTVSAGSTSLAEFAKQQAAL